MTAPIEATDLGHGLTAIYIPRGMAAQRERALRERLGLVCRHGAQIRSAYGRCPACATSEQQTSRKASA